MDRELNIYYNEHREACDKCGRRFKKADTIHLGYLSDNTPAVLCTKCSNMLSKVESKYYWDSLGYRVPPKSTIIWRYMDIAKLISLLYTKRLSFAAADAFEDIFECAKGYKVNKEDWNSFYTKFFMDSIKTAPFELKLSEKEIETKAIELLQQLERIGKKDRSNTYISCWHNNEHESEAMWKLYATNTKNAVAIKTTAGNLYNALNKEPTISIGYVNYVDYTEGFRPVNGAEWYKRKSFEYEKEIRAVVHKFDSKEKVISFPVDVDVLINEIYVSPYAPKWFFDIVKSVVEKYELKKPILWSEMAEEPFY